MKSSEVDWYLVYKKWTTNTGIFEYLFKSSPFVTAKYMGEFELKLDYAYNLPIDIEKKIANIEVDQHTIIIVDVDALLGIDICLLLNNDYNIAPILSYNFLFHPYGVVGDNELMERLIAYSGKLKHIEPITYALILDKNRYISGVDLDNQMIFNNQYEITEEDLPELDMLITLKKSKVNFLYSGKIKEDINCYLQYLKENNIIVNTVDLGDAKYE
ncbi:hypothetical protein [Clostridium akagii]|uniref:hypothetical protein n=1 Tax=Clostridium akagii TaxID=91623 RepID=UPI00047BD8FC|nr:hypothetical protein [Clostridium akagii]